MSIEENKKVIADFLAAMSRGDTEYILDAYADDGMLWTMGNTLISGQYNKAQIKEFADGIYDAFPNGLTFTVHGMVAEGDKVAVEATSEGAHVSGVVYSNQYHFLFTVRDGKLLQMKEYMDTELATDILMGGQKRPA
jgi:ketosteroid isomerase-like protein